MIQDSTKLKVFDNSGIKLVKNLKNKKSKIGSLILASVKTLRPTQIKKKNKIVKGSLVFGYVIKSKTSLKRYGNSSVKFSNNGCILLNKQLQPISSRILGLIPLELARNSKILKSIIVTGNLI
jgi:large subunit ribosomal protein L14